MVSPPLVSLLHAPVNPQQTFELSPSLSSSLFTVVQGVNLDQGHLIL